MSQMNRGYYWKKLMENILTQYAHELSQKKPAFPTDVALLIDTEVRMTIRLHQASA